MTDNGAGKQELNVTGIRNGTVIDHIESAATFKVASILGVPHEEHMVLVGANLHSKHLGAKGIIKIEDRRLTPDEVNKIALIAPNATLNIIEDYRVVEKTNLELPEQIEAIVQCHNPRCVTNQSGTGSVVSRFRVVRSSPPELRCLYCERTMTGGDIILK